MGSVLGRDLSSIQVLWKSVVQILHNPAHKPTKPADRGENITSVAEVTKINYTTVLYHNVGKNASCSPSNLNVLLHVFFRFSNPYNSPAMVK